MSASRSNRLSALAALICAGAAALTLCACAPAGDEVSQPAEPSVVATEPGQPPAPEQEQPEVSPSAYEWLDTELTDAVTGAKFRLADFKGEPVLLHAFATW